MEKYSRESVRALALAIGARAAQRRLGINEKTVLSWSHRGKWKLPLRRNTGRPALRLQICPSDALAEFKRQGGLTRMDMARAITVAAEKLCGQFVAKKHRSLSQSSHSRQPKSAQNNWRKSLRHDKTAPTCEP
jgi:hypothetical protein